MNNETTTPIRMNARDRRRERRASVRASSPSAPTQRPLVHARCPVDGCVALELVGPWCAVHAAVDGNGQLSPPDSQGHRTDLGLVPRVEQVPRNRLSDVHAAVDGNEGGRGYPLTTADHGRVVRALSGPEGSELLRSRSTSPASAAVGGQGVPPNDRRSRSCRGASRTVYGIPALRIRPAVDR
jgi:hypothetical protein